MINLVAQNIVPLLVGGGIMICKAFKMLMKLVLIW
jgi:hypothetical protein